MSEDVKVTLEDDRSLPNKRFANLVDPIRWAIFIDQVKNTNEKRSLAELIQALIEGP